MANCKACNAWFSSTAPSELCPTCERALERLNGYAMPVVRCKDCKHFGGLGVCFYHAADEKGTPIFVYEDDFCSYGERREGE